MPENAVQIAVIVLVVLVAAALIRFMMKFLVPLLILAIAVPIGFAALDKDGEATAGVVDKLDAMVVAGFPLSAAIDRIDTVVPIRSSAAERELVRLELGKDLRECGRAEPLLLTAINGAKNDVGYISYVLERRREDRSTWVAFDRDESDFIIKPGKSWKTCIAAPADSQTGDLYQVRLRQLRFMEGKE